MSNIQQKMSNVQVGDGMEIWCYSISEGQNEHPSLAPIWTLDTPCWILDILICYFCRMKRIITLALILAPMISEAQPNYLPQRLPLSTGQWEFKQASKTDWKPVKIPVSTSHTALLQNGMIEDPWRDNEEKLQWIEKEATREFQTTFDVSAEVLAKKHIELIFKGLDTYAQIYLNDSLLLETDNMFRAGPMPNDF